MIRHWNYAQIQHPMWLIIAEDSLCAERTPPWGSPSLDDYAMKVEAGLDAVVRFPSLHLNFEFSAVELEDMADRYPRIVARMKELVAAGRISFVNGTYSQPHLQILSIESAIRQFQHGTRSTEELTGYKVTCYAPQEPGFSSQLPQILTTLGYKTATNSEYACGLQLERAEIQQWARKWEWLDGDDIINWKGLDGTVIPTWLKTHGYLDEELYGDELLRGNLKRPRLRADTPDMEDISAEFVGNVEKYFKFVQLDRTLEQMISENPPYSVAQIDPNYAYLEGVDTEGLSRANVRAESMLLSLEALESFLPVGVPFDFDAGWKTILKAQHHDVYWTGAPELRSKSIVRLDDLAAAATDKIAVLADALGRRLPSAPDGSQAVLILHPYARKHSLPVEVCVGSTDATLADENGRKTPVQVRSKPDGSTSAIFVADANGLGYQTLYLTSGARGSSGAEKAINEPYEFSNDHYSISVDVDGTVTSLAPRSEANLVKTGAGLGGNVWLYEGASGDVFPEALGNTKLTQGPVFDLVETTTQIGAAKLTTRICLYHTLPWFTVETELAFDRPTEIGDYFVDRTKLHYAWAVGSDRAIRHAVGGASAEARRGKSFLVSPWLDLSNEEGGMALMMFNSTKCWLDEEGWLRCLVAWGHNGDRFHNRMSHQSWMKQMDIRLNGKHTIKYAVWPHAGKPSVADISDWSASLLFPPSAHLVATGSGAVPSSRTFVGIKTGGVIPLSVRPDDNGPVLRMMDTSGQRQPLNLELSPDLRAMDLRNLDGTEVTSIGPHKIVEMRIDGN